MATFSFEIDPLAVLGISSEASLQEIRDAYRRKAKVLHPDGGGEEWAFRVLAQSYEMLSTARVLRASQAEPPRSGAAARPNFERPPEPSTESLRGGIHDDLPPGRLIGVEHLCVRYLWEDAAYLWLSQKAPDDERFLSCSLHLVWPEQAVGPAADLRDSREGEQILSDLVEIFDHVIVSTRVTASSSNSENGQFTGWLSYPSFDRSWKALKTLHDAVRSRDLGLRQWSRDLFIPKKWA